MTRGYIQERDSVPHRSWPVGYIRTFVANDVPAFELSSLSTLNDLLTMRLDRHLDCRLAVGNRHLPLRPLIQFSELALIQTLRL